MRVSASVSVAFVLLGGRDLVSRYGRDAVTINGHLLDLALYLGDGVACLEKVLLRFALVAYHLIHRRLVRIGWGRDSATNQGEGVISV